MSSVGSPLVGVETVAANGGTATVAAETEAVVPAAQTPIAGLERSKYSAVSCSGDKV